ncbi:MAG: folate-binding protein YgfZ [Corynebacteriales bacterium]|nr:folate-binding protein YgfZ [Mycobacteriales bacterium]
MVLKLPGAVAGLGRDAAVAAHYGDPFREQRALLERVGFVDRSHRGVISVSGEDRLSWLHTLTTQHLENLAPFTSTEALVLSPQGRVEHHMMITDDGQTTWLDVEAEDTAGLLAYLESMRFMLRVEPTDVTESWARIDVIGDELPSELLGAPAPTEMWEAVALPAGGFARRVPWPGPHNLELLAPKATLEDVASQLEGFTAAGLDAYEALRVAAQRPRLGAETDAHTIVQESSWVNTAVHLNKGCYRGQETVAKVQNLGQSPRKLVLLHLDGSTDELPPMGEPVFRADRPDKQVGFVGTSARHADLGTIVLAVIKRAVRPDVPLMVGTSAAQVDAENVPATL